jgi:hypothetical protein
LRLSGGRFHSEKEYLMRSKSKVSGIVAFIVVAVGGIALSRRAAGQANPTDPIAANAQSMLQQGRQIFRFDTFGDEAFWGDTVKLHQAVAGAKLGGVGLGGVRRRRSQLA